MSQTLNPGTSMLTFSATNCLSYLFAALDFLQYRSGSFYRIHLAPSDFELQNFMADDIVHDEYDAAYDSANLPLLIQMRKEYVLQLIG